MRVFKQRSYGDDNTTHGIKLRTLGIKLIVLVSASQIDIKKHPQRDWIRRQQKARHKSDNNIGKETLVFISQYSQKPLNFFIDQRKPHPQRKKSLALLKDIKVSPEIMVKELMRLFYSLPVTKKPFTVYSGISREDYESDIKGQTYWKTRRLTSTTFNKGHAMVYAKHRSKDTKGKHPIYILLEIMVPAEIFCIYTRTEDQVIFPPGTCFEIKDTYVEENRIRDIVSETSEDEDEKAGTRVIRMEAKLDHKRLAIYYKKRYRDVKEHHHRNDRSESISE